MTALPAPASSTGTAPPKSISASASASSPLVSALLLPLHLLRHTFVVLSSLFQQLLSALPVHLPQLPQLPHLLPYSSTKEPLHDRWLLPPPFTPHSTPLPSPTLLSPSPSSSPSPAASPALSPSPSPSAFWPPRFPTLTRNSRSRGRHAERQPLTLHVPPSYKSLSLAPHPASPKPILKVRTPSDWSELNSPDPEGSSEGEGGSSSGAEGEGEGGDGLGALEGGERKRAGRAGHERTVRDERVIRFDSVPEVWWIERAERRRSVRTVHFLTPFIPANPSHPLPSMPSHYTSHPVPRICAHTDPPPLHLEQSSRTRHPKEEPSIWEQWFASLALPNQAREPAFGSRMRYDQLVC